MSGKWSFPFPRPYAQQTALMECIHDTIENSKIGILESPTGTGKSLSIICSSLTWLHAEERRLVAELESALQPSSSSSSGGGGGGDGGGGDDWLEALLTEGNASAQSSAPAIDPHAALAAYSKLRERIAAAAAKSRADGDIWPKVSKSGGGAPPPTLPTGGEDAEFLLDEYDSDSERAPSAAAGPEEDAGLAGHGFPKIIYCSRTHSQIAQFVGELKKTVFRNCRCVSLGSRKQLCINDEVRALPLDAMMSETCLEMQAKGGGGGGGAEQGADRDKRRRKAPAKRGKCEYHKADLEGLLADRALGQARDVEELAALGRALGACPYYATRRAVRDAQVVCLPYNMLVHKSLRDSLGLSVDGNVVIIDEAHNLSEAVSGAHSAEVSLGDASSCVAGIDAYLARYNAVLGGRNLGYINLLRTSLVGWKRVLEDSYPPAPPGAAAAKARDEVMKSNDFLFKAKLDNINFVKLKRHIDSTSLVKKIGGYSCWRQRSAAAALSEQNAALPPPPRRCGLSAPPPPPPPPSLDCTGSLRRALELLSCLANSDEDGRMVLCQQPLESGDSRTTTSSTSSSSSSSGGAGCSGCGGGGAHTPASTRRLSIKFILLNAASQFRSVTSGARSVLLLGGTMQPFPHVQHMLFPSVPDHSIRLATFGHVVSDANVLPLVISASATGHPLIFKHDTRFSSALLEQLGETLIAICEKVPAGCPCFFTSYNYMDFVLKYWTQKKGNAADSIYSRLNAIKRVFVESRAAAACEESWSTYCHTVAGGCGALLCCVIGGKMSEGINFSDNLARSVIVVGMPYPDSRDAILQEKLKYAEHALPGSSSSVYESMCMKAVNQCVGRSIRHAGDYASILLLDARYGAARVLTQFPEWIQKGIKQHKCLNNAVLSELTSFYELHNTKPPCS
jgi:chromosome transmission fidelity protein 1